MVAGGIVLQMYLCVLLWCCWGLAMEVQVRELLWLCLLDLR